jgi:hypothetical protein
MRYPVKELPNLRPSVVIVNQIKENKTRNQKPMIAVSPAQEA